MQKSWLNLVSYIIWTALILAACSWNSPHLTEPGITKTIPQNTNTPTANAPEVIATQYIPKLLTVTSQPVTATPTLSQTLEPTLSLEKAQSLIMELLLTNGGCKLPCWWGLTPGKTSSNEVFPFFSSFKGVSKTYLVNGDPAIISWTIPNNDHYLDLYTYFGEKDQLLDWIFVATLSSESIQNGGELVYGDPFYNQSMQKYELSQVLQDYGPPSRVLIWAPPQEVYPVAFDILLDYSKSGFLVGYSMPEKRKADTVIGCPTQAHIYFWLWTPEQEISMAEILSKKGIGPFDPLSILYFKPVEEATKMTRDEFFMKFKIEGNDLCVETPAKGWTAPW
jgi:hypothetical protein